MGGVPVAGDHWTRMVSIPPGSASVTRRRVLLSLKQTRMVFGPAGYSSGLALGFSGLPGMAMIWSRVRPGVSLAASAGSPPRPKMIDPISTLSFGWSMSAPAQAWRRDSGSAMVWEMMATGVRPLNTRAWPESEADAALAFCRERVDAGAGGVAAHVLDQAGIDLAAGFGLERDTRLVFGNDHPAHQRAVDVEGVSADRSPVRQGKQQLAFQLAGVRVVKDKGGFDHGVQAADSPNNGYFPRLHRADIRHADFNARGQNGGKNIGREENAPRVHHHLSISPVQCAPRRRLLRMNRLPKAGDHANQAGKFHECVHYGSGKLKRHHAATTTNDRHPTNFLDFFIDDMGAILNGASLGT